MSIVQTTDVAARLGRPITDSNETTQVQAWIADVEGMVAARLGDLATLIAAEQLTTATLTRVVAAAVIRKIHNPEGLRSSTRHVDDWQVTSTRDRVLSDGQLRLTEEEWADLVAETTPDASELPEVYSLPLGGP